MELLGIISCAVRNLVSSFVVRSILTGTINILNKWTGHMSLTQTATMAGTLLPVCRSCQPASEEVSAGIMYIS